MVDAASSGDFLAIFIFDGDLLLFVTYLICLLFLPRYNIIHTDAQLQVVWTFIFRLYDSRLFGMQHNFRYHFKVVS